MSGRRGSDRGKAPAEALPTPLAQVLAALDRETQPFRAVHRLVDAVEVIVKLHTVILVSRFAEALTLEAPELAPAVRKLIAGGLRTPSLGIWWAFAREAAKSLGEAGLMEPVPGLHAAVAPKSPLFVALEGKDNLIAFRNGYAHGATPDDDTCRRDLARVRPRLAAVCDAAWSLTDAQIVTVGAGGKALRLCGTEPQPIDAPAGCAQGRCYLLRDGQPPLDLHPLLVMSDPKNDGAGAFFYNDFKNKKVSTLHYAWAKHERSEALSADLHERFPIDRWNREESADEAEIREKIAALTESFKGRRTELAVLINDLGARERGFFMIWGPPGMGKSALVARAVDYFSWSEQTQRDAYPELLPPKFVPNAQGASHSGSESDPAEAPTAALPIKLHVVSRFVRRGGFTDVRDLFESLNRQLDRAFPTGVGGAGNAAEAAQMLRERLRKISPMLKPDERLLVVIDGLDEAAEHPEFVQGLPREAPDRIRVLYTSRPQPVLRAEVYEQIEITQRGDMELTGLSSGDTRSLLYEHADKYAISAAWVDAVANTSGGNPLYLRLLCDALDRKELAINEIALLPKQLSELYDGVLRRVESSPLATTTLALLAASHAYLPLAVIHAMLTLERADVTLDDTRKAQRACSEVLIDDPATPEEDWQLFHESLREYLRDKHGGPVAVWQRRLADWGLGWRNLRCDALASGQALRSAELYALRWTPSHLAETAAHERKAQQLEACEQRENQLVSLMEDDAFRERAFLICGNAEALRRGLQLAQVVAVKRHRDAFTPDTRSRVARFAQWTWGEELRLYAKQRKQLKAAHLGDAGATWTDVADLAAMGPRPRDRVMLAVLALWGNNGHCKTSPNLGEAGLERVAAWLEEADETAVSRLWNGLTGY